jgi:hypothetical protein
MNRSVILGSIDPPLSKCRHSLHCKEHSKVKKQATPDHFRANRSKFGATRWPSSKRAYNDRVSL